MKSVLISNAHRTCSLSIPSVEREALGGQSSIGERATIAIGEDDNYLIVHKTTGYVVGGHGRDPLDILLAEEAATGLFDSDD
jgi:hypothetical protein